MMIFWQEGFLRIKEEKLWEKQENLLEVYSNFHVSFNFSILKIFSSKGFSASKLSLKIPD